MKSGSWSSYLAAMPLECRGEPDDEPDRYGFDVHEEFDAPGVFSVWFRSGLGRFKGRHKKIKSGLSQNMATSVAASLDVRYQAKLNEHYRAESDAEDQQRLVDEAAAIYFAQLKEDEHRDMIERTPVCRWCGGPLPMRSMSTLCQTCVDEVYEDVPPFESDDIPW